MIIGIKAKWCEVLDSGNLLIIADCEDFKKSLRRHSPNLLIDYLNENYGAGIPYLPFKRREVRNADI